MQQVQSLLQGKPQMCSSCAVVIPSDVLSGNERQLIDSHECVLRFNAHAPDAANAEDWAPRMTFASSTPCGWIRSSARDRVTASTWMRLARAAASCGETAAHIVHRNPPLRRAPQRGGDVLAW